MTAKEIIERLKNLSSYDYGAWPDGTPSLDAESDGSVVLRDDVQDIITKYEESINNNINQTT